MLAVVPVRNGVLPAGAFEAVAECGGRSLVIGSGANEAAAGLTGDVLVCEAGDYRPGAWARRLQHVLAEEPLIVLPASPDGRDLAPRLAATLDRPMFAGATSVSATTITVTLGGGTTMRTVPTPALCIATLQVGVRGVEPTGTDRRQTELQLDPMPVDALTTDADLVELLAADAATIDLAEAPRIVGGGAGLQGPEQFEQLAELGRVLGASVGATRVVTDRGWAGHERQIGTTGVVVDPRLYIAFGISGAVQHTSGLGTPDHIISINTDAHCPMMQLADLAVVGDANQVLAALLELDLRGG
jgi:electron transfer flavoprotein alpha subunit